MARSLGLLLSLLTLIAVVAVPGAEGPQDDVRILLEGVKEMSAPGAPGALITLGPQARAVVAGGKKGERDTVVACSRWEKGRVVAWAHDGYLIPKNYAAGTTQLLLNSVNWSAGNKKDQAHIGVLNRQPLVTLLKQHKQDALLLNGDRWFQNLEKLDVLIAGAAQIEGAEAQAAVKKFVTSGGGLIIADTGWGWAQLHPGKSLSKDHPGNQLLYPAGLLWTAETSTRNATAGFQAEQSPALELNASAALEALFAEKNGSRKLTPAEQALCSHSLSTALSVLPRNDTVLLPRLREARLRAEGELVPTPKKPIKADKGLARALIALEVHELQTLPAREIKEHPAAKHFPGSVEPATKTVARELTIDTQIPDWHSTGLYAPPGKLLTVAIPDSANGKGLSVRIGCHSDALWQLKSWPRLPEVCRSWPLTAATTEIASGLGGLVYVVVPHNCKLGSLKVTIQGGVEAPLFVLGKTTPEEWINRQAQKPGPWAELATSKLIITVPSKVIRDLRDPVELMKTWDRVLDADADLARIPRERKRPERFVLDEEISAGYMHSGYPLMAHLDVAKVIVDSQKLTKGQGCWGFFHEIGHNHQEPEWTFDGTVEVTVNLFTMYAMDKVCQRQGLGLSENNFLEARRNKVTKDYLAKGARFEDWKKDPFLALCMYIQLQQAFGWEAFQDVFEEYRKLPEKERPRTEQEKRDQWLKRFSMRVNKNLGPFFQAWGVPTSETARAKVAHLPKWLPNNFPPQ